VAAHRGIWPVGWMCTVLGITRGGFYAWLKRPRCRRAQEDEQILVAVRRSFTESDATYGVRRVWDDLQAWYIVCGRERIARLMRTANLVARPRKRRLPKDSGVRPEQVLAANVLNREFQAAAPDQRWVADFTYIWTWEGWLYLAVVLDLFSRRVVGWSMRATMTAELVADALLMAIWRRGWPTELLHHSDQGSQYLSELFQRLLSDHGIDCSMSRRGDCWDNAAMESFFSTLKVERVYRRNYRTRDEAKADLFQYMEGFYNPRRRHSTLGGLSPMEFEKRELLA
jgi:putative transposase